ncbi:YndJ family protein [Halonotius roseus]|uniref:YndJ-like protein n=1 Tax=Halonotius roseus TaxID=2511997 RepID=A0A544QPZ3_9EURY|nr:YndJ family protein [Halonotius roseus]TQQ81515.1 hypothetical protein EWF95_00800 [Halonotius roseus]
MAGEIEPLGRGDRLPTLADASALVGALGWLGVVALWNLGPIRNVIALAVLVLVPLVVRLTDTPRRDGRRSRWYRLAVLGQPVAAVPAVVSLSMQQGAVAAVLALPWVAATVAIAGFGAWRLLERGPWPLEEVAVDAGLIYILVGGIALLIDRAGVSLVFEPILITLTVVHFHYAGAVLPTVSGLAGRVGAGGRLGRALRATTGIIIVGPGIIAVGITAVALGLPLANLVELIAVTFFTTAVAVFSLAVIGGVLPRLSRRSQQLTIGVASLAVTLSMGFAVLYGLARATGGTYFGIDAASYGLMVTYHGRLNAYGFALLAVVGWRLGIPDSRARPPGIPFSRLSGGWRIGADFLDRKGLTTDAAVSGMMDRVDAYDSAGFDPTAVAPSVRRFFERSGEYDLDVDPDWARPWKQLAGVYRPLATRIGQLSVPLGAVSGETALTGRVVGVDVDDHHTGDRAWIRSNADRVDADRRMTYVGVYDRYNDGSRPYLRVAFPLPGGTLTGILRVENGGSNGDGLVLSSYPTAGNGDDAGLYLVARGFGVRLPLNETLVVVPDSGSTVEAVHRVELLGVRIFTLRYRIRLADEGSVDTEAMARR